MRTGLRRTKWGLGVVGMLGLGMTGLVAAAFAWQPWGRVVARVEGEKIATEAFLDRLLKEAGKPVLQRMIDELLIRQAAERRQITVSEEEIDQKWEAFRRMQFPNEADYERWRKENQDRLPDIRAYLREEVLVEKLARLEVQVTDEEIARYYQEHPQEFHIGERVHAYGILLESRENALEILKLLRTGQAQFADMARAFSLDPATKDQGGDMGLFERGTYAEEIEKVVFELKPGEISDPVEIPSVGYYLFKVTGQKPPETRSLDEVREDIRRRLDRQKFEAKKRTFVQDLRQRAQIEILDERLR